MYLLAICISSLEKWLFKSSDIFDWIVGGFFDIELYETCWFLKYIDFYLKGKFAMLPLPHLFAEETKVVLCLFIKREDFKCLL